MALPIPLPLAISAIKALLRFRDRVDVILSLKEASDGLPFALPPAPADVAPFLDTMLDDFFKSENGQLILQLKGLSGDYQQVLANRRAPELQGPRNRLFNLYFEAADIRPPVLGPTPLVVARTGPGTEMRLAYYVVESERLSRNPALTRILLASADTLLEFAGENASLFISNPGSRGLVEKLIDEFAGKRDFDDEGAETIFKTLLGSTIVAVAENQGKLAEEPALKPLFAAIADVRDEMGDDFVARIISVEGFEKLLSTYLTHVAEDPSFITSNDLVQKVLAATLKDIGQNLPQLIDDPKALVGVLEVGLTTAAANVSGILERQLGDQPLLAAVLSALVGAVSNAGQNNQLFESIANGKLIAGAYKAVLEAIAANPDKLFGTGKTETFISNLISGLAQTLSEQKLSEVFSTETLQALVTKSFEVLAANPEFLAGNSQFAVKLLGAVFQASATASVGGFSTDDFLAIATAAIKTASENLALTGIDDRLAAILSAIGSSLADNNLQGLLTANGRKDVLLAALQAIAANPVVWGDMAGKNLVQPLVQSILAGLETDPSRLLSGPALVESIRNILLSVSRYGQNIVNQNVDPDALKRLLTLALQRAEQEIGKSIDGENLPDFLKRVVAVFLKNPFTLPAGGGGNVDGIFTSILANLEPA